MKEEERLSNEMILAAHPQRKIFRDHDGHIDWVIVFLAIITAFIAVGFGLLIYLIAFHDNPPAEIFEIRPEKAAAAPGEFVSYFIEGCIYSGDIPVRSMTWEDTISSIVSNPGNPPTRVGCGADTELVRVPEGLFPNDSYYLVIVWDFAPNNFLIHRLISARVGPFTVLAPVDS